MFSFIKNLAIIIIVILFISFLSVHFNSEQGVINSVKDFYYKHKLYSRLKDTVSALEILELSRDAKAINDLGDRESLRMDAILKLENIQLSSKKGSNKQTNKDKAGTEKEPESKSVNKSENRSTEHSSTVQNNKDAKSNNTPDSSNSVSNSDIDKIKSKILKDILNDIKKHSADMSLDQKDKLAKQLQEKVFQSGLDKDLEKEFKKEQIVDNELVQLYLMYKIAELAKEGKTQEALISAEQLHDNYLKSLLPFVLGEKSGTGLSDDWLYNLTVYTKRIESYAGKKDFLKAKEESVKLKKYIESIK